MTGHVWTQVQWGVLYKEAERFRHAGEVEFAGTRPNGTVGNFTESDARYIARSGRRAVVRRVVVHTRTEFDWEED